VISPTSGRPVSGPPAIGTTLTLRVATPVGSISVVGELVDADETRWSIRRRDGSLTLVEVSSIEAQRVVPPGKSRLATAIEVEQVATLGWRALATARLGDWLLRASGGFTSRANSVLGAGDPGCPLDEALATVTNWYAEHGLPAQIQVPEGADNDGLAAELAARGWPVSPGVHVMTGEIAHSLRALPDPAYDVWIDATPDDAWLGCYARVGNDVSAVARQLLTNHPDPIFASIRDGEEVVAIARSAVDGKWAGLFAVEVMPEHRRRGLGAEVSVGALREAARRGARRSYLQCSIDNTAAVALYTRLNLGVHHDYVYYLAP
jgi:ribosomal protein S18 acetylase RimI-like enzyme